MGLHFETETQREEAYYRSHSRWVVRNIMSNEFRLGTVSYANTGHIPQDHFWSILAREEQRNPSKFFAHNPQYAGFFTAPDKLGELPRGNVIFDVMKDRDLHAHAYFELHRPFYAALVDRDLRLEAESSRLSSTSSIFPTVSPAFLGVASVHSDLLPITPGIHQISTGNSPDLPVNAPGFPVFPPIPGSPVGRTTPIVHRSTPPKTGPDIPSIVPEPASILMLIVGLVAAIGAQRFCKKRQQ